MNALQEWQSFYVLVGSAAGALIGLQFVLMALIADLPVAASLGQAAGAFGTPTVVHFSAALVISASLSAPWRALGVPTAFCGAVGVAGAAYVLSTARLLTRQTSYRPDPSDWFFYVALPFAAYAIVAASGLAAALDARDGLFGLGAASLLLLLIGIRNAWDSVTYHVFVHRPSLRKSHRD